MNTEQIAKAVNSAEFLLRDLKELNDPMNTEILALQEDVFNIKNQLRLLLIRSGNHA